MSYCIVYSLGLQPMATVLNYICPIIITPLDKMNSHDKFTWTYSVFFMYSGEREKQQKIGRSLDSVIALFNLIFRLHPTVFSGSSFILIVFPAHLNDCVTVSSFYSVM